MLKGYLCLFSFRSRLLMMARILVGSNSVPSSRCRDRMNVAICSSRKSTSN
ncbi:hypothetical protein DPMN_025639 [Dreissena polymorpha]|uniref:Uncharacterized protein n=1 Tax=Dreissena polymorpha TaxID=45954 RepID=A0A9D4HPN4_DREPO|nr:hypothetical protein DPMN_052202 [Dreissena polymorpha]KAH3862666.1 hypothetical protein DPMN_025639 [Dreissena polymorpha]